MVNRYKTDYIFRESIREELRSRSHISNRLKPIRILTAVPCQIVLNHIRVDAIPRVTKKVKHGCDIQHPYLDTQGMKSKWDLNLHQEGNFVSNQE